MNDVESASANRATILIVDDTPINLAVLGDLLHPYYRVRVANSGELALRTAASDPVPDLILLDIMMPGMDGFEVLRRLQAAPATSGIPVIFVTAIPDEEAEQRGFEMGAADYIHKPIRGAVVLARIRVHLQAKAAREMLAKNNRRLEHKVEEGRHALELAQMQLLQSEKMAAMGQLAAGVAHEINNPIGFVGSNLNTLQTYLGDLFELIAAFETIEAQQADPASYAAVEAIRKRCGFAEMRQDIVDLLAESREGVQRVRRIVKDLKDFSRAGDTDWQWADIHQGLDSTLNIVWNELKYHCRVTKEYGSLPKIYCIPSQLNQVFMNLLVNAAHAIEGSGEIVIKTEMTDDDSIRVSVSDSGVGISPEALPRIFEPFFTTKPVGQGTGLGLSIAWGIVQRHHGEIDAGPRPGGGTVFRVKLPVGHRETVAMEGGDVGT